jgi:hypothetical protein
VVLREGREREEERNCGLILLILLIQRFECSVVLFADSLKAATSLTAFQTS